MTQKQLLLLHGAYRKNEHTTYNCRCTSQIVLGIQKTSRRHVQDLWYLCTIAFALVFWGVALPVEGSSRIEGLQRW